VSARGQSSSSHTPVNARQQQNAPSTTNDVARRHTFASSSPRSPRPIFKSTDSSNGIIYINPRQEHIHRKEIMRLFTEQTEKRRKEGLIESRDDEDTILPLEPETPPTKSNTSETLTSFSRIKRTLSFGAKSKDSTKKVPSPLILPAPNTTEDAFQKLTSTSKSTPITPVQHQRQRSLSNSATPVSAFQKQRSASFSETPRTPGSAGTFTQSPPFNRNNTVLNLSSAKGSASLRHSHHTRSTPQLVQLNIPSGNDGQPVTRSLTISQLPSDMSPAANAFTDDFYDTSVRIKSPPLSHDGTSRPNTHSYSASAAARLETSLQQIGSKSPKHNSELSPKTVRFVHSQLDHSPTSNLQTNRNKNQQKKFWMPDKSVNKCYDCQSVFTVFKRKHHCRVCGQIFCWKCSNNFVEGEEWNFTGRIRVCNFCLSTHNAAKDRDSGATVNETVINSTGSEAKSGTIHSENGLSIDVDNTNGGPPGDALSTLVAQIGDTPVFMSKSISNLSLFNASVEVNTAGTSQPSGDFDHTSVDEISTPSADNPQQSHGKRIVSTSLPKGTSSRTLSQINTDGETLYTPGAISSPTIAMATAAMDETSSRMDIALTTPPRREHHGSIGESARPPARVSDYTSDTASTTSQENIHFDSVATLPETDVYYSDSAEDGFATREAHIHGAQSQETRVQNVAQYQTRTQSIIQHAQNHLRKIVRKLLLDEGVSEMDAQEWLPILVDVAWKVVTTIRIDVNQGDKMDIRQYVNIKAVEARNSGKAVKHAEYINGVVFRGNVVNRHMRSHIRNPSILLIKSPIQFYRHPTRMTSFDVLLLQEYDYLTLLVEKIAEQRPDIVFVHKSVSRIAQDLLWKRGISLVCNTKLSVMQRISRASQIPILNTVDELEFAAARNQLNDPEPNNRTIARTEQRHIDYNRGRTKTLFVLRTRKQDTEGTVLLKSNDMTCLRKVKKVLQFSIFVAYNVRLEAALCVDSCGTFLSEEEEEKLEEQERSNQVTESTPYSSTPIKTLSFLSTSMNIRIPMYPDDLIIQQAYESSTYDIPEKLQFTSPLMHQNIIFLLSKIRNSNVSSSGSFFAKDNGDTSIHALYTPPETVVIAYYTPNDMTLGQYLMSKCFHAGAVEESRQYARSYAHNQGKLIIEVERTARFFTLSGTNHEVIMMWSVCKRCGRCVTPLVPMTSKTYNYSFGKFLEVVLYDNKLRCNTGGCNHLINRDHVRYFGFRDMIAKFSFQPVCVYEVVFPSLHMQYDDDQQARAFMNLAERLVEKCDYLFQRYNNILSSDDMTLLPSDLRDDMLAQQRNLIDELRSEVIKSKNIYALNRFTRSLYVHAREWNRHLRQYSSSAQGVPATAGSGGAPGGNGGNLSSSITKRSTMAAVSSIRVTNMIASVTTPSKNKKKARRKLQRASGNDISPLQIPNHNILVHLLPTQNANSEDYIRVELSVKPSFPVFDQSLQSDSNNSTPLSPPSPAPIPVIEDIISGHIIQWGGDVFVYDNEPSSIIAYTLRSKDYHSALAHNQKDTHVRARLLNKEKFHVKQNITSSSKREVAAGGPPSSARKRSQHNHTNSHDDQQSRAGGTMETPLDTSSISVMDTESDHNATVSLDALSSPRKSSDMSTDDTISEMSSSAPRVTPSAEPSQSRVPAKTLITCTVYYSRQFSALRQLCCEGDEKFIYSLARCVEWKPTGGKSGSLFIKSWDDRFVIKHVPRVELLAFVETAPAYFEYMAKTLIEDETDDQKKLPTVLVKILGVYKLSFLQGKKLIKQNVIVMENLFYNAQFDNVFDLKGSLRNRFQKQMDAVKLDENLLREMQRGYQLATRESEKERLTVCIYNDTLFLSKLNVMDYSLLVGVDSHNQRLLVGIIDYVRQYTWDKHLETLYKSTKLVGKKKVPTVISPKLYKTRFREATVRYFPSVLTHFNFSQMSIAHE